MTITADVTGIGLWTDTNINASETVAPTQLLHNQAGAVITDPVNGPIYLANERVKIVVAQGGVSKTGTFIVVVA